MNNMSAEFYYKNAKSYDKQITIDKHRTKIIKKAICIQKAKELYLHAINLGHIKALDKYGKILADQESYDEADKYFKLAIDKGYNKSYISLAEMYRDQDNFEQAVRYYQLAIENGFLNVLIDIAELYGPNDQAKKYLKLAVKNGDINAYLALGELYESRGNEIKAQKYFDIYEQLSN